MATAKVHDLKVRPVQSVDLCFEMDGIIGEQNLQLAQLGTRVTAFDLVSFCANFGQSKGDPTRPGLLKFDSQAIYDAVKPTLGNPGSLLFALRAEPVRAILDKAIAGRENTFYTKYVNQVQVINETLKNYDPTKPNSKPDRLNTLTSISQTQHDTLDTTYKVPGDPRNPADPTSKGVVKVTTSDLTSDSTTAGKSDSTNKGTTTGSSSNTSNQSNNNSSNSSGTSGPTSGPATGQSGSQSTGTGTATTTGSSTDNQTSNGESHTTDSSETKGTQHTVNTNYDYRYPSAENDAQYQRAQVSLQDERFNQFMFSQNLPFLKTVFDNELKGIDLDVKRLQVAYLSTILVSPVSGLITGIFRDVGDCVKAGQPVIRVENDTEVYLVGTLIFRGLLAVGATVTLTTKVFDSPQPLTVTGKVVSVRGHDSEDEEWNVLVRCGNRDAGGNAIFPINYNFDYDDTTVDIS
jgi:hypothetical protein